MHMQRKLQNKIKQNKICMLFYIFSFSPSWLIYHHRIYIHNIIIIIIIISLTFSFRSIVVHSFSYVSFLLLSLSLFVFLVNSACSSVLKLIVFPLLICNLFDHIYPPLVLLISCRDNQVAGYS